MTLILAAGLLQAPARDTVVAIAARDGLTLAVDVSILILAVAVVVTALMGTRLMMGLNRTLKELRGGVRQGLGPVSERARAISDNVEFITQALRSDVERLNASVKALTARLHQASDHMEERIEEFNALMEVVQGEAEEIFIDTASTVRGVREGARSITRPARSRREEALPEAGADVAALPGVEARQADDADGNDDVSASVAAEVNEEGVVTPSSQS
jgi:uncharacterized protein YoxC